MAKTFKQMVDEALAEVPRISPAKAQQMMQKNPATVVINVRDAVDINATGTIPGAMSISLGTLTYKADNVVDEACGSRRFGIVPGPSSLSANWAWWAPRGKLLKDMGSHRRGAHGSTHRRQLQFQAARLESLDDRPESGRLQCGKSPARVAQNNCTRCTRYLI